MLGLKLNFMKKIGIVDLKGGFGNQIFQVAYALFLKNHGLNVYIDKRFFKLDHPFPRNLEINPNEFGFKQIEFKNNRLFFLLNTFFEEQESFELNDLRLFNRFVGYYQDFKFIELSRNVLSSNLGIYKNELNKNIVAIHLRKTDYLTINQVLSDKYYQNAIEHILKINIFRNIHKIYFPTKDETPIKVFQKLSNYQTYIIANSSFSALAAYLSKFDNKNVYYPEPWFRKSNIQLKGIPNNWNAIKNY